MINDLLDACNDFKMYLEQGNQRGQEYNNIVMKINAAFKSLKSHSFETSSFVENNMTKLYKIHEILVGSYAKLYLSAVEISKLRAIYDGFFQKVLGLKRFPSKIKFLPTKITQQFCQGITFFESEYDKDAHPFYHRNDSCGYDSKTAKEKFSSIQVKNAVKMCYLERAIYDQVYINLLRYQDLGHLRELRVMEKYYDEYFPNEAISLKVKFNENDDSWPIELAITSINYNIGNTSLEIYRKPYDFIRNMYKNEVHCTKLKNFKRYEKVQSYKTGETSWMAV